MRDFAPDTIFRLLRRLAKERSDLRIAGGGDTTHREHFAGDSLLSHQDREIRYFVDALKTVVGNQRDIVTRREGSQHLADQLIRKLENGLGVALEPTFVMPPGIEIHQADEYQISLLSHHV